MDKMVDAFRALSTPTVADVFRYMGYPQQVMDPTILPIRDGWSLCGRAFTHANLPARKGEDYRVANEAENQWAPGEVIVESYWGAWGVNYAIGAALKGCLGAVIDGPYRDLQRHREELSDFPVFCRRGLPDRSANPGGSHRGFPTRWLYAYNVPINCGGVRVDPGDIILGDDDGVVVIPRDLEEVVLGFSVSYEATDIAVGLAKGEGKAVQEATFPLQTWLKESGLLAWLAQTASKG
ncbi:MAG: RraA family protein [Chloroflexota bacterium]